MGAEGVHVVMIPWSAFGHLMPFFQLSIALAKAGVHVSFISTPTNINRLPSLHPHPDLNDFIDFVPLPLPPTKKGILPDGAESTFDLPFEKISSLKYAYDNLHSAIDKFVSDRSPDYLIVDVVPYWVTEIAQKHSVSLVLFTVFSACTDTFLGAPQYLYGDGRSRVRPSPESLTHPPEWVTFNSSVAMKKHEAVATFSVFYGSNGTPMPDSNRIAKVLEECQAVVIRTCDEYEDQYLDLFRKMIGKTVIPAGLLPVEETGKSTGEIFEWLEKQKPKSVLYVAFGCECKLSKGQTYEVAHGLALSEVPFLWVLRKPEWAVETMDNIVPQGFRERTAGRGMVTLGLVAQVDILANPAIGGSLYHGGWGSTIEMLQFGHRLVAMPFMGDQPLNARLLVEKGLALEVETREGGGFRREDIRKAVRKAMESEDGEKLEANARAAAQVFGDHKLHEGYIDNLVEYLKGGAVKHNA